MPQGDLIGMNYQGDPAQGFGNNPSIPTVDPRPDLKNVNDTIRTIMLLDNERNLRLYNQKVHDRDMLTQQIMNNQVSTGEIDPKDQKFFDKAKQDVEDQYNSWGGNWNDTKGYRKYQEAVTHLQDVATHAQSRWAMMKQLEQQKSQQTLPHKQKQMQDFIDKQGSRPFWDHIDPYQELFSYDHERMQSSLLGGGMVSETGAGQPEFGFPAPATEKQTVKTTGGKTTVTDTRTTKTGGGPPAPKGAATTTATAPGPDGLPPLFTTSRSVWDYGTMQKRATALQIENGVDAENQNQWLSLVEDYPEDQKQKFIDSMNARIGQYNMERGFQAGQRGFVEPIKLVKDGSGKSHIAEPAPDFAAKTVLAGIDGNYAATTYKFDKDAAKFRVDLEKAREKEDYDKKNLAVKWFNANTARRNSDLRKKLIEKTDPLVQSTPQIWDDIIKGFNVTVDDNFEKGTSTTNFTIDAGKLPAGFQNVAGLNEKGQPIRLEPKGDIKKGEKPYYDVDFFIPKGTVMNGYRFTKDTPLNKGKLIEMYKKQGGDNPFESGGLTNFIQGKIGDKVLDYELIGKDGKKANRVSAFQSQTAIGNKDTKKGQINPYALGLQQLIGILPDAGTPSDSDDNSDSEPSSE